VVVSALEHLAHGAGHVAGSWLVLHLWWVTTGVSLVIGAWWLLFLVLMPAAWKQDQARGGVS
jgi:hypothetical protein